MLWQSLNIFIFQLSSSNFSSVLAGLSAFKSGNLADLTVKSPFSQSGHLETHTLTHTGDNGYDCLHTSVSGDTADSHQKTNTVTTGMTTQI